MNAAVRMALLGAPRVSRYVDAPSAESGLVAQGVIRDDLDDALTSNLQVRGGVRDALSDGALSASDIADLQRLASAYRGLDAVFLSTIDALYAARARVGSVA